MTDLPRFALSIRQPWAWAILHLGKPVENRTWSTHMRGPICIHAGKGMTRDEYSDFIRTVHNISLTHPFPPNTSVPLAQDLLRGGIVGTAILTRCVSAHRSPWFFGPWGFVLENVKPVDFIPCKGALGFFEWDGQE